MGSVVLSPGVSAWLKGALVIDTLSGVSSGYALRVSGTAYISGTLTVGLHLNVDGNYRSIIHHGDNHALVLSAANNGGGTGEAGLYTWISEPGQTWTGAAIARNMVNVTGFTRVNTGLTGQIMKFDEGETITFGIETAAGARTWPLTINTNGITTPALTTTALTVTTNLKIPSSASTIDGSIWMV